MANWRWTDWQPAGARFRFIFYTLQKQFGKLVTHYIIIEADRDTKNGNPCYINGTVAERGTEVITDASLNYEGPPGSLSKPMGIIQRTLWYKLCTTPYLPFSMSCGYLFMSVGTTDADRRTEISYKGGVVYTSPTILENKHWSTSSGGGVCCSDVHLLIISETENETTRHMAFIEGTQVLESEMPITSLGCCTTHDKDYRYALLGTGDFIEKLDETEITLTDGTRLYQTPDNRAITRTAFMLTSMTTIPIRF